MCGGPVECGSTSNTQNVLFWESTSRWCWIGITGSWAYDVLPIPMHYLEIAFIVLSVKHSFNFKVCRALKAVCMVMLNQSIITFQWVSADPAQICNWSLHFESTDSVTIESLLISTCFRYDLIAIFTNYKERLWCLKIMKIFLLGSNNRHWSTLLYLQGSAPPIMGKDRMQGRSNGWYEWLTSVSSLPCLHLCCMWLCWMGHRSRPCLRLQGLQGCMAVRSSHCGFLPWL